MRGTLSLLAWALGNSHLPSGPLLAAPGLPIRPPAAETRIVRLPRAEAFRPRSGRLAPCCAHSPWTHPSTISLRTCPGGGDLGLTGFPITEPEILSGVSPHRHPPPQENKRLYVPLYPHHIQGSKKLSLRKAVCH